MDTNESEWMLAAVLEPVFRSSLLSQELSFLWLWECGAAQEVVGEGPTQLYKQMYTYRDALVLQYFNNWSIYSDAY